MTAEERLKLILSILRPKLDEYITIYMIIILYLSYLNTDTMIYAISTSVVLIIIVNYLFNTKGKNDNSSMKKRRIAMNWSHELLQGKLRLALPISLMLVGSLTYEFSYLSLGIASVLLSVLIADAVTVSSGRLKYKYRKSDQSHADPVLYRCGDLYAFHLGDVVLYMTIAVDRSDNLGAMIDGGMTHKHVCKDVSILRLMSAEFKKSKGDQYPYINDALNEYSENGKTSKTQLVDENE